MAPSALPVGLSTALKVLADPSDRKPDEYVPHLLAIAAAPPPEVLLLHAAGAPKLVAEFVLHPDQSHPAPVLLPALRALGTLARGLGNPELVAKMGDVHAIHAAASALLNSDLEVVVASVQVLVSLITSNPGNQAVAMRLMVVDHCVKVLKKHGDKSRELRHVIVRLLANMFVLSRQHNVVALLTTGGFDVVRNAMAAEEEANPDFLCDVFMLYVALMKEVESSRSDFVEKGILSDVTSVLESNKADLNVAFQALDVVWMSSLSTGSREKVGSDQALFPIVLETIRLHDELMYIHSKGVRTLTAVARVYSLCDSDTPDLNSNISLMFSDEVIGYALSSIERALNDEDTTLCFYSVEFSRILVKLVPKLKSPPPAAAMTQLYKSTEVAAEIATAYAQRDDLCKAIASLFHALVELDPKVDLLIEKSPPAVQAHVAKMKELQSKGSQIDLTVMNGPVNDVKDDVAPSEVEEITGETMLRPQKALSVTSAERPDKDYSKVAKRHTEMHTDRHKAPHSPDPGASAIGFPGQQGTTFEDRSTSFMGDWMKKAKKVPGGRAGERSISFVAKEDEDASSGSVADKKKKKGIRGLFRKK